MVLNLSSPRVSPVSGGRLGETDSLVSLFVSDGGFEIRTRSVPEPVLLSAPQILLLYHRSRNVII